MTILQMEIQVNFAAKVDQYEDMENAVTNKEWTYCVCGRACAFHTNELSKGLEGGTEDKGKSQRGVLIIE